MSERLSRWAQNIFPEAMLEGTQYVAGLILALLVTGNYGQGDARHHPRQLLTGCALATALALWTTIWTRGPSQVLPVFLAVTSVVWTALLVERVALDKALRILGVRPRPRRALFVGEREQFLSASRGEVFRPAAGYQLVGFVSSDGPQPDALGQLSELHQVLFEHRVDSLVIWGHLEDRDFRFVVQAAYDGGCELLAVPRQLKVTGVEPRLVWRSRQPLVELTSPAVKGEELILKRLVDLVASSLGLVVLAPVFALVALAIKVESPGAVFYRSPRWGRFGTKIGIWKFRTMVDGAAGLLVRNPELRARFEENSKLIDDPRITRVGRWLRGTSIDELPQLLNVLAGEMSLVGPRPKLVGEELRYGAAMDTVLCVRPGITGLWQVSGRNETTFEDRIALDVKYASHPSLWTDFEILGRTIPVVLGRRGAG